jgi:hypothetical protein
MQLTGQKTRAVFGRYNIVSDGDFRAAAEKLDQGERHDAAPARHCGGTLSRGRTGRCQSGLPNGHSRPFGGVGPVCEVSTNYAILRWCRRGDSNPHTLAGTRP